MHKGLNVYKYRYVYKLQIQRDTTMRGVLHLLHGDGGFCHCFSHLLSFSLLSQLGPYLFVLYGRKEHVRTLESSWCLRCLLIFYRSKLPQMRFWSIRAHFLHQDRVLYRFRWILYVRKSNMWQLRLHQQYKESDFMFSNKTIVICCSMQNNR